MQARADPSAAGACTCQRPARGREGPGGPRNAKIIPNALVRADNDAATFEVLVDRGAVTSGPATVGEPRQLRRCDLSVRSSVESRVFSGYWCGERPRDLQR
ncbi:hypothetical protein Q0Z83_036820 [Actinoplanes sichuanensis]|nr:hypothetical protein Q0Z83_036820 [Actinoplanes sichuanensis]